MQCVKASQMSKPKVIGKMIVVCGFSRLMLCV